MINLVENIEEKVSKLIKLYQCANFGGANSKKR